MLFFSLAAKDSFGQSVNEILGRGDALFTQKKYTESLDQYEEVLRAGVASPQMLLKMAFIKEGLGEYPEALFYLTEYYQLTNNRQVLTKINEIATKQGLEGYNVTDVDHFRAWYYTYADLVVIGLMAVLLLLFVLQAVKLWRKKQLSVATATWQVVFAVLLGLLVNLPLSSTEAIIIDPSTFLMKGPSAGAPMMEIVSQGHKVKVLDEGEVWTKIQWKESEVYVRSSSIRRLG